MPFEVGNKLAKGGKREGAGRKSKAEIIRLEQERQGFLAAALKDGKKKGEHYSSRIYESDAVLIDYRKWLTDRDDGKPNRPIAIQVVIEAPAYANGHANGAGVAAQGAGNGGPILIGGD